MSQWKGEGKPDWIPRSLNIMACPKIQLETLGTLAPNHLGIYWSAPPCDSLQKQLSLRSQSQGFDHAILSKVCIRNSIISALGALLMIMEALHASRFVVDQFYSSTFIKGNATVLIRVGRRGVKIHHLGCFLVPRLESLLGIVLSKLALKGTDVHHFPGRRTRGVAWYGTWKQEISRGVTGSECT